MGRPLGGGPSPSAPSASSAWPGGAPWSGAYGPMGSKPGTPLVRQSSPAAPLTPSSPTSRCTTAHGGGGQSPVRGFHHVATRRAVESAAASGALQGMAHTPNVLASFKVSRGMLYSVFQVARGGGEGGTKYW